MNIKNSLDHPKPPLYTTYKGDEPRMLTETSSINFRTNNSCSNSCNYLARKNAMALYNKDDTYVIKTRLIF